MAKKILVQIPSYSYILVDGKMLEQLMNTRVYDRDWDHKIYHLTDNQTLSVQIVEDKELFDMCKESALEILEENQK